MRKPNAVLLPARQRTETVFLSDMIAILRAHPAGLRRWSLMRAMRTRAEAAGRDVSPKFEDDVERSFRRHCAGDAMRSSLSPQPPELFYRPKESVGEVWALDLAAAEQFLSRGSMAA